MTHDASQIIAPSYPTNRRCPYELPESYARLRDEGEPIRLVTLANGRPAWVVTSFDVARRLLTDPRMSSDRTRPEYPRGNAARSEGRRDERPTLLAMDPPEHDRQRRMLTAKFSAKQVGLLRGEIERIVHGYLDSMLAAGPPADFVADFALPVPSAVICLLLGVPDLDHAFFQEKSRQLLQGTDAAAVRAALVGLEEYFGSLVATLQREPAPGVMGELVAGPLEAGDLTREDVIAMGAMLLVAGHETTASMTSLGMVTLLDHPDQLSALRADRSLIPGAVEELLRYLSIAGIVTTRVAASDIEVDGQLIRAGDVVIIDNFIANRDGAAFEQPDRLDIRRAGRRHLAFGYGVHQCLGQHLARLELEIILNALLDRVPTLRLEVAVDQLPLRPGNTIFGVERVPVTWLSPRNEEPLAQEHRKRDDMTDTSPGASVSDVVAVTQLILRERQARDRGWWDIAAGCFHPESTVELSWFRGSGAEFVASSAENVRPDSRPIHRIGPPAVQLSGERAVAENSGTIAVRRGFGGVEADMVSYVRGLYRCERRAGEWLIKSLTAIYEWDTLTPVLPGTELRVPREELDRFRPSYRFLSYVMSLRGVILGDDLYGEDRPEPLAQLYKSAYAWMRE